MHPSIDPAPSNPLYSICTPAEFYSREPVVTLRGPSEDSTHQPMGTPRSAKTAMHQRQKSMRRALSRSSGHHSTNIGIGPCRLCVHRVPDWHPCAPSAYHRYHMLLTRWTRRSFGGIFGGVRCRTSSVTIVELLKRLPQRVGIGKQGLHLRDNQFSVDGFVA
jgi:hypothetical protein